MQIKNYGVLIELPRPTDYVAGGASGIPFEVRNPEANWEQDLPEKEDQFRPGKFDTMSCVSFSSLNTSVETQLNRMIRLGQLDKELVDWLNAEGYIQNGKVNCSDRYLAKVSGTRKTGNTLLAVADATRVYGFIPEKDWPMGGETWEEYMAEIPPELIAKGKRFLERFNIQYEWVRAGTYDPDGYPDFAEQLKHAPIQIAIPICPGYGSAEGYVIPACTRWTTDHAVMVFGTADGNTICRFFDSYFPHKKQLGKGYYVPWAMKYVVTPKQKTNNEMPKAIRVNKAGKAGVRIDFGNFEMTVYAKNPNHYYMIGEVFKDWLGGRITCVPDASVPGGFRWGGFDELDGSGVAEVDPSVLADIADHG